MSLLPIKVFNLFLDSVQGQKLILNLRHVFLTQFVVQGEMSTETSKITPPPPALPWTGHCACGHIRYSLNATPLIIHCCHCHQCQIETGSVGAVNLIIESSNVS